MHVRIGPYRSWSFYSMAHWLMGKPDVNFMGNQNWRYNLADWIGHTLTGPPDKPTVFRKVLDKLSKRRVYVYIDDYDVWNMDDTLKYIIHPMLIKLRDTKRGSGMVDDCDVPENLRSTAPGARDGLEEWECDHNLHYRYDWVLNEMIWAFDPENSSPELVPNTEGKGWDVFEAWDKRCDNARRLFAKYYVTLWT